MSDDQIVPPAEDPTESAGPASAVMEAPSEPPPETFAPPVAELPSYDFAQSARMGGTQLRALSAMHDVLADELTAWLTAKLRESVRVSLTSVEEMTFGAIVRQLERPSCVYLYEIQGSTNLTAMMLADAPVAFAAVDRLLGGTSVPIEPGRALTELEQRVSRLLIERVRSGVEEMWSEHVEFRMLFSEFEAIPDLLDFAETNEPFLVSTLSFEGDGWSGSLKVHLPFALLESSLSAGAASEAGDSPASTEESDQRSIHGHLLRARVTVDARLPAFMVTLGELKDLAPGTVINTRIPTSAPVEVSVCGQTRFTAVAGRKGQELAVRVLELADGGPR